MSAIYSPSGRALRLLDRLPGGLSWLLITLPLWGPLLLPDKTAAFLVAFSIYVLWRTAKAGVLGVVGIWRLRRSLARDWRAEASRLNGWDEVHHVVIYPTYLEPIEVLVESLEHLERQDFPRERVSAVVAFEESDLSAPANMDLIRRRFDHSFGSLLITSHRLIPGEVPGKSANVAWAAREAKRILVDGRRLDPARTLVTVCDADSRLHSKYLSALTHAALADPDPLHSIYQALLVLRTNPTRAPSPFHMLDATYSVNSLAGLVAPYRLLPLSTYSLPLLACHRVDYWDPDVIPEDSRMFFKMMFGNPKPVRVRPLFVPVLLDAAEGASLLASAVSRYRQARRWAWGLSDVPYLARRLGAPRGGTWLGRLVRVAWYVEDHLIWGAAWPLFADGLHPWAFLAPQFWLSPEATHLANTYSSALTAGLPLLVVIVLLDLWLRSTLGERKGSLLIAATSWILFPILSFALIWLPALDAHTRVLLGRPLAYQVTPKLAAATVKPELVAAGQPDR